MKFTKPNHYQNETNHNLMQHKTIFRAEYLLPEKHNKNGCSCDEEQPF